MKKRLLIFLISIMLIGIGTAVSIFEFMDYEYINDISSKTYAKKVERYEIIPNSTVLKMNFYYQSSVKIIEDNTLENIIMEITYYDEKNELIYDNRENNYNISFKYKNINDKKIINNIIDDLKNKKVYNYSKLAFAEVVIYANKANKNLIEIRNAKYKYI